MYSQTQSMDVFESSDRTVLKYIHDDNSETAVKRALSARNVLNPLTLQVEEHHSDRQKYSVFVSSSVGCFMACPFCHLTIKRAKFSKLSGVEILSNLKDAISDAAERWPDLADRYIKISWMGMGDAIVMPQEVRSVTLELLDWVLSNGYAAGLDGADLSTVMPRVGGAWKEEFLALNQALQGYPKNPEHRMDNVAFANQDYACREPFRLFYSVHSALEESRSKVVPNAMPLEQALSHLEDFSSKGGQVVFHHMLVDGLNDSIEELDALCQMMSGPFATTELRVLRYNFCAKSTFSESHKFLDQIRTLARRVPFLKVQVSPGSEVSAACGQFIVRQMVSAKALGT